LDVSRNRISKIENLLQNINDIMDVEVPIMLENQKSGKTKVVPVILRRCGWTDTILSNFQGLPKDGIPIQSQNNVDETLYEVYKGIKKLLTN